MHEADVWVDSLHVGRHLGGYLPFYIEIPSGRNITVRLRNTDNSLISPGKNLFALDFNYYGGLYRHVWLLRKPAHLRFDRHIRIQYENISRAQVTLRVQFSVIHTPKYPYVGYALSDQAQYRDAYKIKKAGFNLVRCSHYPPSPAFLDACDRLGLLVINSIPGWQFFSNETFQKNSLDDVREMLRRDCNHPSVFLWEASLNESPMTKEFMARAHAIVKEELSHGLTSGWLDEENIYDVFTPARQHGQPPDYYKNYRAKNNKPLLLAESQCTSCAPMIFIASYWTNSSNTSVTVYSNCEHVELQLNGERIMNGGKQQHDSSHLLRPPYIFNIDRYIPGRLDATGFISGKAVVRIHQSTPGNIRHHLNIEIDLSGQSLTTKDLVFVYAYICDHNDTVIPNADDLITFSLLNARNYALLIGDNPVRAEAGIASILLKTTNKRPVDFITLIARASTIEHQETRRIFYVS
ncbi:unnamed protein product [Rotaria sp. Silwood1]|nr:unnamed protein product [Rotaria sp. Silwood1]CAF4744071.1 unnamed protein product [Rotaria sp. Silwood1]